MRATEFAVGPSGRHAVNYLYFTLFDNYCDKRRR